MYEYNKLQNKLNEKGINKSDLTKLLGLSSRTIAKISKGEKLSVNNILETVHHFRAIDYVIDNAEDELTEEFIKHLHLIIKRDTYDSTLPWFAVGDYKKRGNAVSGRQTARQSDVSSKMQKLIKEYSLTREKTLEDIIAFHV